jgi:multiple sugar transport system ATP-binding protein
MRPKVFLFDEPLSNLDATLRSQMRIELQKLHREINATMIYVTHDQTEAMTLGNRIVVLNKGKLMQLDTPMNLYNRPANRFVAGFIGSPTMNFITGHLKYEGSYFFSNETEELCILFNSRVPDTLKKFIDKSITIGIRPEDISLSENIHDRNDCTLKVAAYENMGNEQIVYLTLDNQTLIVRRPASVNTLEIGNEIGVSFSKDKIFFLEEESGKVI